MPQHKERGLPLSPTSLLHYIKLTLRSGLFLIALWSYLAQRVGGAEPLFTLGTHLPGVLWVVWVVYIAEMCLRFFPSRLESMGCQKQFQKRYRPAGEEAPAPRGGRGVAAVAIAWLLLNAGVAALYFLGAIDAGMLLLISLAFAVCDMICILFFCPFQTWFMKNKCCVACRIYNWDYAMMFTPLILIPRWYTWSLVLLALGVLLRWELVGHLRPERFSEAHNAALSCAACSEKLCHHKRQLRRFLIRNKESLLLRGNALLSHEKRSSDQR